MENVRNDQTGTEPPIRKEEEEDMDLSLTEREKERVEMRMDCQIRIWGGLVEKRMRNSPIWIVDVMMLYKIRETQRDDRMGRKANQ